jgi:ketosteroid isomerase-like protein
MYRWLVRRCVPVLIGKLVGGRTGLVRWVFTPHAEFVFPGQHSFAAHYRSREQIARWLGRFAALRPVYVVDEVMVAGAPWDTHVAVRFHDRIGDDYANEGMHYLRLRWGRVAHDRVFLDTQAIEAWEDRNPSVSAGRGGGALSGV